MQSLDFNENTLEIEDFGAFPNFYIAFNDGEGTHFYVVAQFGGRVHNGHRMNLDHILFYLSKARRALAAFVLMVCPGLKAVMRALT